MAVKDGGKFGENLNFETPPSSAHSQQAAKFLFFAEDGLGIFFKDAREYECLFFFHCVFHVVFFIFGREKRFFYSLLFLVNDHVDFDNNFILC